MVTEVSWFEYWSTRIFVSSIPSLPCVSVVTDLSRVSNLDDTLDA